MRVFLKLSYDGANYAGWQVQPNVSTVQGTLNTVFGSLYNDDIQVTACGRTDKGVHATRYYAHADVSEQYTKEELLYKLNRMLPIDIACQDVLSVSPNAHTRFDADSRSYTYHLHFEKNPFKDQYSTYFPYRPKMDVQLLPEVAEVIKSTSEFGSFCKLHGSDTHTKCDMMESYWDLDGDPEAISYHITANRFLRGMVRLIVGSSLAVSLGQLTLDKLQKEIESGTRNPHMKSAPPQGLALSNVTYPDSIFTQ